MDTINAVLGIDQTILSWWQICIRALLVFIYAILLLRFSDKRFFGKHSAFDIVLGFILGSILSRAITGNSPFFGTLLAAFVILLLHKLFGYLACNYSRFGTLIKGKDTILVKDGEMQRENMYSNHISENDMEEALRTNGNVEDLSDVKIMYMERNGDISVIKK